MNTSACRRATAEETRRNNCFSFLITPWCFPPAQPCNEKHTKGISVVQLYRLHQKVCVPHPLPLSPHPPLLCPPLPILFPPLCVGRPSTLAVHVFTNVSEYLIVIIPLSSASGGLSVRTAELCLRCYCYCYFKKKDKKPQKNVKKRKKRCVMIYFVGFLFGRSAHFQIKEDKFQG